MLVIGIMGGIASGKSNISGYLARRGAFVIDADIVARELQEVGKLGNEGLRAEFGDEFFNENGELLRAALGAYVFGSEERMRRLNAVMLPLIDERMTELVERARERGEKLVVIDAAILYESKTIGLCDEVWLVTADKEERIRRIQERNGLTRENAQARIASQKDDDELRERADRIIVTEGTIEETRAIVDGILRSAGVRMKKT